jgi:hypothetical protein
MRQRNVKALKAREACSGNGFPDAPAVRDDKVRLGIEAPAEVTVHRKEVYEKINGTRQARLPDHCCTGR